MNHALFSVFCSDIFCILVLYYDFKKSLKPLEHGKTQKNRYIEIYEKVGPGCRKMVEMGDESGKRVGKGHS